MCNVENCLIIKIGLSNTIQVELKSCFFILSWEICRVANPVTSTLEKNLLVKNISQ